MSITTRDKPAQAHTHTPEHTHVTDGGKLWEVCDCGATRFGTVNNPGTTWHTCKLCTHPYGLVVRP